MFMTLLMVGLLGAEPSDDAAAFQEWLKFYAEAAAAYRIEVQEGRGDYQPLTLQPAPVLQYTNPERGFQQHGAFYVWTLQGRPLSIGAIWSNIPADDNERRWVTNELHSLSTGPLRSQHAPRVGKRGPVPQWVTEQPGIVWSEFENAPMPTDKPSLRLVQMRRLAEAFTARISNVANEKEGELRLLTKPLYRYPPDVVGAIDGGLFAFVQGTDPEVLLLIEAVETNGQSRWRYAFARFTHTTATVQRDGRTVWECPKAEPYVGQHPYFLFWKIHAAGLKTP
ncbi:MAG: hypothetical protein Q8K78_03385 [Planctomycetaceae bacterium]|nr:hypothetical protein [Planctomycetaceae bacterium]